MFLVDIIRSIMQTEIASTFLILQVAAVPDDVGTAGALRAIAHHLTAKDVLVSLDLLFSV